RPAGRRGIRSEYSRSDRDGGHGDLPPSGAPCAPARHRRARGRRHHHRRRYRRKPRDLRSAFARHSHGVGQSAAGRTYEPRHGAGRFPSHGAEPASHGRPRGHPRSAARRLCPRRGRGRHFRRFHRAKLCQAFADRDPVCRRAAAMTLPDEGFLDLPPQRLEYRMIGPRPDAAPTIVMLHEGLGCEGLWGAFPEQLSAATGTGVFVYSRAGYGNSSSAALPRPLSFMDEEALDVLPRVLAAIGFKRGILFGHSDGASIATIYAGSVQDHRVRGLVLMAPHFFTEAMGLTEIRRSGEAFKT